MVDVGGCKIGVSNEPERRRWEIPYPSRLPSCSGADYVPPVVKKWHLPLRAVEMEGVIKAIFRDHSVDGSSEWFNVSPHAIIQTVNQILDMPGWTRVTAWRHFGPRGK
jgi:hypothetical protein